MPQQQNDQNGSGGDPNQRPQINWRLILPLILIFILVPTLINLFQGGSGQTITYTRFKQLIAEGQISTVIVENARITGTEGNAGQQSTFGSAAAYTAYLPPWQDDEWTALLQDNNVTVSVEPPNQPSFLAILIQVLPFVFLVWIFFSLFRNMRGQGRGIFQVGENKAKLYEQTKEKTTFDDVAGLEGAKEEVMEIVDFLRDPTRYTKLGARSPKGILLVGPPGTGKTLIARAIAGEAGAPFFSMSGSDFMEMFVGVGASRVRNLFKDAKKKAPSIIFIDELDSIGRHRGAGVGGGHDEREQTLNQMLSELDGFEQNESTVVIAATNRPDILDPALLRPGRFDRQITIPMPTKDERAQILKVHAAKKPLDTSVDLNKVAGRTIGFSGAELQNLLNEAALYAARRRSQSITMNDVDEAWDRIIMGLERKSLKMNDHERKVTAYHEAGHAITAAVLPNLDPISKVSIVPRGRALGVTVSEPVEDRYNYTREYLENRIAMSLGGRAAEMIVFKEMTNGAANDLKQCSDIARQMVSMWGMSENMAHIALGEGDRNVFLGEQLSRQRSYSEATAREIDEEVMRILRAGYETAERILKERRAELDTLAEELLDKEQVNGDAVLRILGISKEDKNDNDNENSEE
ncbi:MAG: ATP-dependent zinc metalloprotease FtsH [Spirochaetales bacterium]